MDLVMAQGLDMIASKLFCHLWLTGQYSVLTMTVHVGDLKHKYIAIKCNFSHR
jgi:hypothetical protein